MSAPLDLRDLVRFCDDLLDSRSWDDFGPNGLQVEGRREVRRVVTGVTACRRLLIEARERGADAVLVHHGLYWKNLPPAAVGWLQRRLLELLPHGISLLAYHLPLDGHPEIGNNVLGARALGLEQLEPFAPYGRHHLGVRGRLPEPISPDQLLAHCRVAFADHEPLLVGDGPRSISTVGLVSGGAQGELYRAIDAGLDAYITGEASEWVTHIARECGIHYIAAGHHATERSGVRALGERLVAQFDLEVEFIDIPNPV